MVGYLRLRRPDGAHMGGGMDTVGYHPRLRSGALTGLGDGVDGAIDIEKDGQP